MQPFPSDQGKCVDAAIAAIAGRQFGLITRCQLLDLGLSSGAIFNRIARGRLSVVHPAVYAVGGAPVTWDRELLAALLGAGEASAISHLAAGVFWKFDGIAPNVPHLLIPHGRRIQLRGVVIHRSRTLEESDIVRRQGFRVTSPTRTLIDLSGSLSLEELENALDDALRRKLVTIKGLASRLARIDGRVAGIGRLRRLVAERSPGWAAGSPVESRFRRRLAKAGLPAPTPQSVVTDERGRFVARVDFAYPDRRLAIEIDGWAHHSGRRQWEKDLARQNRLKLAGWDFLRFTRDQADHDLRTLAAIEQALGELHDHYVTARLPKAGRSAGTERRKPPRS